MGCEGVGNLYVHFPFCRGKCTYCALHSGPGHDGNVRAAYVARLVKAVKSLDPSGLATVYFGGGTPALCDLAPLLEELDGRLADDCEFSVELHPLDVSRELLAMLKAGGVNRISMGVQSLDDGILAHMKRGYAFHDAERSFYLIREYFDNAGIDLIIGYPGETAALTPRHARLAKWGLTHCSAYSLILEEKSELNAILSLGTLPQKTGDTPPKNWGHSPKNAGDTPQKHWGHSPKQAVLPSDDEVLNRVSVISRFLEDIGLKRYEISNYAVPGRECRHNLATWRGEDYIGLGDGAHGRLGRQRTRNWWGLSPAENAGTVPENVGTVPGGAWGQSPEIETVSEYFDNKERKIFGLRTREGLDAHDRPDWVGILDKYVAEGMLSKSGTVYRLTERGTEVCDSILAEL